MILLSVNVHVLILINILKQGTTTVKWSINHFTINRGDLFSEMSSCAKKH